MRPRHPLLPALAAIVLSAATAAGEPIRLSTTGNATLGAPPLDFPRDAVVELRTATAQAVLYFDERNFPNAENVDAFHALPNGHVVLSTAAEATLGSPAVTFQDGDLVDYNPATNLATVVFAEAEHFTDNQDIDAVHVRPDGTLVLSTRDLAVLGVPPLAFGPGDLVAYDPATRAAAILLPVSRFAEPENVDAVHLLPDGRIVLSVERETGARLGGVTFRNGDLVAYDPVADVAVRIFSEDAFGADEDVDAVDLGCGNGVVEADEQCDEAGATPTCHADCTIPTCGDGILDPALGEECDDGGETVTCDADCTVAACGDGTPNAHAGEQCDDGGESAGCDADCTLATCGDGTPNASAGEACDDGGESAACDADCTLAACGDATTNATRGETCDDGGTADGDCCAAACTLDPAGTACPDDGDACTTVDACDGAGTCAHLPLPALGCRTPIVAGGSSLTIKDKEAGAKDRLVWKWAKGAATALADFGDPGATDGYTLCLYEEPAAGPSIRLQAAAPAGGVCAGRPCWSARASKLKYVDKERTPDGLQKVDLKAGADGKAKVAVKGQGELLTVPSLPLEPPFRVQLLGAHGVCWEARYSAAGIRSNVPALLRARSD